MILGAELRMVDVDRARVRNSSVSQHLQNFSECKVLEQDIL